ncbi:hypothetical protein CMT75_18650 [Elizabethkingia anophelis]|nr:hypothetical protein [Elizabethkingia anophelis]
MLDIDITKFNFTFEKVDFAAFINQKLPANGRLYAYKISVSYDISTESAVKVWIATPDNFTNFLKEILNEKELLLLNHDYINEQSLYNSFIEFKESIEERYFLNISKCNFENPNEISFFSIKEKAIDNHKSDEFLN